MEIQHAKKLLKDGYEATGFDVVDERQDGSTILRYPAIGIRDVTLKITPDDARDYAELLESHADFEIAPAPCSLVTKTYREQLLTVLDASIDEADFQEFLWRDTTREQTYIEIDRASLIFANYFRFDAGYLKLCLDRILAMPEHFREQSEVNPVDVRRIFARPLTIRVYKMDEPTIAEALQLSDTLIDSSLFTLAYLYDTPLMLADTWTMSRFERRQILRQRSHQGHQALLPQSGFRRDWVRLYQAGLATPIASQSFLSYWQILEYFFQDVQYRDAQMGLEQLFDQPDFEASDTTIQHIIQMVESSHNGQTTEDLIEQLIRTHYDHGSLRDFIAQSGGYAADSIRDLAERLTNLHQAIVSGGVLAAPLGVDSQTLDRFVPIVKYLAERLILTTEEA